MSQAEPPTGSDLGSRESPACKHLREEVKGEDTGPTPTLSTLGWGRAVYGVLLSLGSRDSCLLNIPAGWVSPPPPHLQICLKRPESYIRREEGPEPSPGWGSGDLSSSLDPATNSLGALNKSLPFSGLSFPILEVCGEPLQL